MSTNQKVLGALGAIYVLIGILGFIPGITVQSGPPGQGLLLGIFAVNVVHNIAHLAVGALMLWGAMAADRLRLIARVMAVVFALLVVASFLAPLAEGVAINLPDTILHLVSMLITGYIGFMAERGPAGETI